MPEQDSIQAKIGSRAPDFRLQAHTGSEVSLASFLGKHVVVLFFVREFN